MCRNNLECLPESVAYTLVYYLRVRLGAYPYSEALIKVEITKVPHSGELQPCLQIFDYSGSD